MGQSAAASRAIIGKSRITRIIVFNMPEIKRDTGKHMIRAQFVPDSMNVEKRTVDVTFATNTPVLRFSWARDE